MTGIPNQPSYGAPLPPQPGAAQPQMAPQTAAAPVMTADQLALRAQVPAPDLTALRMQLHGSPAEAASALYQLKALAASNGQAVMPLVIEQLDSAAPTTQLAALDILKSMHATQAAAQIQHLAQTASDPSVRAQAQSVYNALVPSAATAGMPGAPGATAGMPSAPGAAAGLDAESLALFTALLNPQTAPYAAVQMSKLPTPQLLAITGRLLQSFSPDPHATNLVATILAKRPRDPGVADQMRLILQKDPTNYGIAQEQAALALESLHNPNYLHDILRFLCSQDWTTEPVKRAIIDDLAKSPTALANPGTTAALAACLNQGQTDELRAAASHALGLTHSPQARDALANSPLLNAGDPKMHMRALWDLGQQPAPYPPIAMQHLQTLAQDGDPQVKALAAQLLKKK